MNYLIWLFLFVSFNVFANYFPEYPRTQPLKEGAWVWMGVVCADVAPCDEELEEWINKPFGQVINYKGVELSIVEDQHHDLVLWDTYEGAKYSDSVLNMFYTTAADPHYGGSMCLDEFHNHQGMYYPQYVIKYEPVDISDYTDLRDYIPAEHADRFKKELLVLKAVEVHKEVYRCISV